jgi:hypothetical protein
MKLFDNSRFLLRLTGLYMYAASRRLGCEKPQSGLSPLCGFVSVTFGAGVVAAQRPIPYPKRHIQPERYTKCGLNLFDIIYNLEVIKMVNN